MTANLSNPLLSLKFNIPFDAIKPEHVEVAVKSLLELSKENIRKIEQSNQPCDYDSTLGALETATEQLEVAMTVVGHLESVASTPELRDAYNAVQPEVSAFYASIPLRTALYARIKEFADTPEAARMNGPRERLLKKTLDDFRRHGAELGDQGKARLEAISRELAQLTSKFAQNVVDATADFELVIDDEAKLAGLPESARAAAAEDAKRKGVEGWRFTLQAPSVIPVLTYLDDREIRKQIYEAYNSRACGGTWDNIPLVEQIVKLRAQKAEILGYKDFSDLVLEDRMAKSGEAAERFVVDLTARTRPAFDRENRALEDFAKQDAAAKAIPLDELKPWDVSYYAERQRQKLFNFDEEELRPYFPTEAVVKGLFHLAEQLYAVSIRKNDELARWHEDVEAYDIFDEDGSFLAAFYADFYPREEKRGGAWMNAFITGTLGEQGSSPHLGLICSNISPPVGGKPALLNHREVETLFHEFGHLIHHCLSKVSVRSLAGTNVAWDFVELPSQIMENWCWEREALDSFAQHYETGQRIPQQLFEKMLAARTYRQGNAMMRQLGFASTDLALHRKYDPSVHGDLLNFTRQTMQEFAPTKLPESYAMITGFGHLFSSSVGYAAGYYSYKWAEVLEADAFTRFKREGIFSRKVGTAFKDAILSKGDSDDPMNLYKTFMGREPSLDPLLQRSGLAA